MANKNLAHLFDIQLDYKEGKPPLSTDGKVGKLIGSGEGKVDGAKIKGKVHWTLFEAQSDVFCASNLFGVITTDDDAEIKFDSMGFFQRPDKGSHVWNTSAGVSFVTDDNRYAWLNSQLAVWEGELDMQAYHHHYQVYAK